MLILFCSDPFNRNKVDPDFEDEFASAIAQGLGAILYSFEALTKDEDPELATQRIIKRETIQPVIYRGWMLTPVQYGQLYNALKHKNYELINTPVEYQNCHYLPDSYQFIKNRTPKTIWIPLPDNQPDYQLIFHAVKPFGSSPLIIKDYVKSQKHYWDTACFVPDAGDLVHLKSVIDRFLALQGSELNAGLAIREFVTLEDLTTHPVSGMPLKLEYRLFFLNRKLIACNNYWDEGIYTTTEPIPLDPFIATAQAVESNFFSMDVAKTKDGAWIIIELGDGQVAGLPENADKAAFFSSINNQYPSLS